MAITMVLSSLVVLLIAIPMMDRYVKNEAKFSVKERKSTLAFHLAEAGLDRGYWKIKENDTNWTTLATGGTITGYDNDVVYTDVRGGSYKIKMQQGATNLEVWITATGKDHSNNEFRAIKAVYTRAGVAAAVQAASVASGGNVNVHWGPMMSTSGMVLKGGSNELYPRKYARSSITSSGGYADRDNDPNAPNKGPKTVDPHIEWWSYNESPGVPDILTPDTSYYITLAKSQTCTPAGVSPAGSCYYTGNYTGGSAIGGLVDTTCTVGSDPKVRFFTGNVDFKSNKYFCGVLIVLGNMSFVAGGKSPEGDVTANPPSTAWKEYQVNVPMHNGASEAGLMKDWNYDAAGAHPGACGGGPHGDTAAEDEYPGDAGYHTVSPYNFKTGRVATGSLGLPTGTGKELSFKGYIYVGGTFDNAGGGRIFGSVQVAGAGGMTGGGDIFYDDGLNIKYLNVNITRSSWYEVTPVSF